MWHRDLKPENVLWNDSEKIAVVADFGIAHFEEQEIYTAVETRITSRMANFQYSAPEQRVRNQKVDHRADIFALGLILHELFTGEVAQGSGYKKIVDVNSQYGYLDGIVDAMIQNNPENRLASIADVKKELIGRKNEFVALQKYDEVKRQVVNAAEPTEFEPITIRDFDYSDGTLHLKLSRNVPMGWTQEFQHHRGGHEAIMEYGPEQFRVFNDMAAIGVHGNEQLIQQLINHAKQYVDAANKGYVQQVRDQEMKKERQQKAALEKQVQEAELRKNILANVKL